MFFLLVYSIRRSSITVFSDGNKNPSSLIFIEIGAPVLFAELATFQKKNLALNLLFSNPRQA